MSLLLFWPAAGGGATLSQSVRLDNASTVYAATVAADWNVNQGSKLDNANALNAHRLDMGLSAVSRFDNFDTLFAGAVHLSVLEALRLDNASAFFVARLDHGVLQGVRLDDGGALYAALIHLSISEPARLDESDTLYAGVISTSGAATLAQGQRLDNASILNAHRLDLRLFAGTRFDNANDAFSARLDLDLIETTRLESSGLLIAPQLDLLVAALRHDNATTFGAHRVDLGLAEPGRLDNTSLIFGHEVRASWLLTQVLRIEPSNVLFAPKIDLGVAQALRLESVNALFAHALHVSIAQGQRLDNVSLLLAADVLGGFTLGIDVAYATLRSWFETTWTATARRFENENLDPPADLAPFVFFEVDTSIIDQSEIGSGAPKTNIWREEGEAWFHVLVASGTGSRLARQHAEGLALSLQGLQLANGVRIGELSIGAGEELKGDGNYWDLPVIAEWTRDNWKLGSD